MNSVTAFASFLRNNAWFTTRYLLSLTIACFLGLVSVKVMVNSTALDASLKQGASVIAQVVPSEVAADFDVSEANLTPKQWQQIASLLKFLPSDKRNVNLIYDAARARVSLMPKFGDFVFNNFDKLSSQAQQDWHNLQSEDFIEDDSTSEEVIEHQVQQKFIGGVLSASEVKEILDLRADYELECRQIDDTSKIVDRLLPELLKAGLKPDSFDDPGVGLYAYMDSYKEYQSVYIPDKLPPIDFTFGQVVKQLAQPPLSSGSTSAQRASSAPPATNW
jgi:hypothetical protein